MKITHMSLVDIDIGNRRIRESLLHIGVPFFIELLVWDMHRVLSGT
jgi:hypothetical protein